ncbi:hypothetical protein BDV09DRAFT_161468 [Aspergillus tetrazonus]
MRTCCYKPLHSLLSFFVKWLCYADADAHAFVKRIPLSGLRFRGNEIYLLFHISTSDTRLFIHYEDAVSGT